MNILLLIIGLALILAGANFLVEGSSAIARRFGWSDFVVGMTIVAIGTSTPEMVVSFISALQGKSDIAIGNVVGSNIFNTLVILGLTAVLFPVRLTSRNIRLDIPFGLLASVLLCAVSLDRWLDGSAADIITRSDGLALLGFFGIFMVYTLSANPEKQGIPEEKPGGSSEVRKQSGVPALKTGPSLLMIAGGLSGLVIGGNLFVDSAGALARQMGVSEAVIAVTLMAGGTSLPELASSLVAAYKKKTDLALGNVLGSNISNIFLILGGSAVIHPLKTGGIGTTDLGLLTVSSLLLFLTAFTFRKKEIDRPEGILFLLIYGTYLWWLLR